MRNRGGKHLLHEQHPRQKHEKHRKEGKAPAYSFGPLAFIQALTSIHPTSTRKYLWWLGSRTVSIQGRGWGELRCSLDTADRSAHRHLRVCGCHHP
eukprot:423617-Prorocentrum_minimum.AAC.1